MKWIQIFLVAGVLVVSQSQAATIFKCKTPDGRTIFSSAGCGTEVGEFEQADVKVNEVGSLASPDEVRQLQRQRANDRISVIHNVKVITDSSKEDSKTVSGNINKRLRIKEETMEQQRIPDPSGVTEIRDSANETQQQKAMRLKTDEIEQQSR